jgi:hypothetical protein
MEVEQEISKNTASNAGIKTIFFMGASPDLKYINA